MQLSQKHVFWYITHQNWSSGLASSWAKEQTKKHRPLTFHPFVRVTPWTDWHAIWDIEWHPRHNHPCEILCQSVKGFLGKSTPKVLFPNNPYNCSALPCRLWTVEIWPAQRQRCRSHGFLPAQHQHHQPDRHQDYQQCCHRDLASPWHQTAMGLIPANNTQVNTDGYQNNSEWIVS